jgi:hypothetical protein
LENRDAAGNRETWRAGPQQWIVPGTGAVISAFIWMLKMPFLFAIPLFLLFFTRERRDFNRAVLLSAVFTVVLTVPLYLASGGSTFKGFLGGLVIPLLLTASLFWLNGTVLRLRYRIALMGIIPSLALLPFIFSEGIRDELVEVMYSLVNTLSSEVYAAAGIHFSPDMVDSLFTYVMTVMLNGYCLTFICIYLVNWFFAGLLSWFRRGRLPGSFYPEGFYNDRRLAVPLGAGIAGIIAGLFSDSAIVSVISWNVTLCTAVFFAVQGTGIVRFMLIRIMPRAGFFRFVLPVLLVLLTIRFFLPAVCFLVLIAVAELWVPIRQKMMEK